MESALAAFNPSPDEAPVITATFFYLIFLVAAYDTKGTVVGVAVGVDSGTTGVTSGSATAQLTLLLKLLLGLSALTRV